MKNLKISLITLSLLAFASASNAQSRLQFSDIYVFGNAGAVFTNQLNNSEIYSLEKNLFAPGIVTPSASTYPYSGGRQQQINGSNSRYYGNIGMMAGWNIRGARLGNQKLRLGFSSGEYSLDWDNYNTEKNIYRVDTLVSQQTGKETYIDSINTKSLYYQHSAQMFNLHADYLLYINPRNKFSFYTGIGASVGFSLSNNVRAIYNEYSETDTYEKDVFGANYNFGKDIVYESRSKRLSPAVNYNLHSLVGVNYRISKRNRLLKSMNLFAEMKMGLAINTMEDINPSAGFNLGGQTGLRVAINNNKSKKTHGKQRPRLIEKRKRRRY